MINLDVSVLFFNKRRLNLLNKDETLLEQVNIKYYLLLFKNTVIAEDLVFIKGFLRSLFTSSWIKFPNKDSFLREND